MRIGIIGMGLGGAAAGAALSHRGCDVTLFEQAPEIREVGAGVTIWANAIRLFWRMGLMDELDRVGVRLSRFAQLNKDGEFLSDVAAVADDGVPAMTLHRAELLGVLANRVPAGRVRLGKRCVEARQDGDEVTVRFEDGETAAFDVLIAADGIRSVVQGQVVPSEPPLFSGTAAYRGLLPSTPDLTLDNGYLWTDRKRYITAFPVSGGRLINFVALVPSPDALEASWQMRGDPDAFRAEFDGWAPRVRQIVERVEETYLWGLYYRRPFSRMANGRIALLGDAAHPMTPHAGMGFGQAIEDGFALATLLADCPAADVPERLKLYEQLRLPRATAVQNGTRQNVLFFHQTVPLAPGETRPERINSMQDWVLYDVEQEAERMLREGVR